METEDTTAITTRDACFFAAKLLASADRQLLALVPPESAVVAGIGLSPKGERPAGNLLIISKINWEDISQLLAWTGADASREIHQLMIASLDFIPGGMIHHSLLAKGHFDRIRIHNFLIGMEGSSESIARSRSRQYRRCRAVQIAQMKQRCGLRYLMITFCSWGVRG